MAKQPLKSGSALDDIAGYVKKNMRLLKGATATAHRHGGDTSVREADYKGHHIVIRTTYEITVDDIAVRGHMGVDNDGQVHYHPVPNASFASAVDLVRHLIDTFPDDFKARKRSGGASHDGHEDDHAIAGVKPPKTKARGK